MYCCLIFAGRFLKVCKKLLAEITFLFCACSFVLWIGSSRRGVQDRQRPNSGRQCLSAVLIVPIPMCVLLSYICWQVPQGMVYRTDKDLTVDVTVSSAVLIVPIPVCVLLSYICWQVPQGM